MPRIRMMPAPGPSGPTGLPALPGHLGSIQLVLLRDRELSFGQDTNRRAPPLVFKSLPQCVSDVAAHFFRDRGRDALSQRVADATPQ